MCIYLTFSRIMASRSSENWLQGKPSSLLLQTKNKDMIFSFFSSLIRPKRLTLRPYKEYWFVFKDTTISYYKNKETSNGEPIEQFHLRGRWQKRSTSSCVLCCWRLITLNLSIPLIWDNISDNPRQRLENKEPGLMSLFANKSNVVDITENRNYY